MKKALLLSILITSLSYSQSDIPKVFIGLGLGTNSSFFNSSVSELGNNESLGYSSYFRFSAQASVSVFYKVNDYLRVESGIKYVGKGTEYRKKNNNVIIISDRGTENAYHKTRFRLNYLEIPIKTNINLKKVFKSSNFEYLPVYLTLGLSGAINIKSDLRSNSYVPGNSRGGNVTFEVKERFETTAFNYAKPFILNSIISIKYIFIENISNRLSINLEYNQSLQNVYNDNLIQSQYNFKTKNGSISLSFGIEFN